MLCPRGDRAGSQGETRWLRLGTHRLWGHCVHQGLGMSEWERRRAGGASGDEGEGETERLRDSELETSWCREILEGDSRVRKSGGGSRRELGGGGGAVHVPEPRGTMTEAEEDRQTEWHWKGKGAQERGRNPEIEGDCDSGGRGYRD